jgi:hypothetical protein
MTEELLVPIAKSVLKFSPFLLIQLFDASQILSAVQLAGSINSKCVTAMHFLLCE